MTRLLLCSTSSQCRRGNSSCRADCFHFALPLFVVICAVNVLGQAAASTLSPSEPQPSPRIDLSAIGYHPPSLMQRITVDEANVSLNFVDQNRVLLTFDRKRLFQRLPGCTPDHQDRLMHAVIIEVSSGRVVKEADWYLHDRRRYLWPLNPGTFLLRRLNDLYIVDSNLQEQRLLSSPKDLLWVAVTPDGGEIIIETPKDREAVKGSEPASQNSPAKPEAKFVAQFLDTKTLAVRRTVALDKVVALDGTSKGYVDLVHKSDIWLLRFGPGASQRHNIARVRSRTVPDVRYTGNHSLLIGRCASVNCDYNVTSFSVTGQRLWRQRWNHLRSFPVVAYDRDNNRFGVSTLQTAPQERSGREPGASPDDPDNALQLDPSERDTFRQDVQILETASGNPILSLVVTPAVLNGQNFSLSPDGRRLAVLQGDALEFFDLPQISSEEQTKSAQLKTEVPDLFAVSSSTDSARIDASAAMHESTESTRNGTSDAAFNPASLDDSNPTADTDASDYQISSSEPNSAAASHPPVLTEQELEAKAGPISTIRVSTRAVVVDVVVTDAKGHPVKGLKQDDFYLAEDGKPQRLGSFREFHDDEALAITVPTFLRQKPDPNLFTNETAAPDPGSVTMVLFDLLNTPSQDQTYAGHELIKFLKSKPKNVQFALCALSAGDARLRLIQGFTQDESVLLAAARGRDKKETPQEVRWQSSALATENSVGIVGDLAKGGRTSGFQNLLGTLQGMQAEQRGTDADDRVTATVDSLMQLARYLSSISGRKNVVWLSGSFPLFIPAPDGPNDSASDNRSYSEPIKLLSNLLAEAQVAVYPVDVRGLVAGGLSAESTGYDLTPPPEMPNSTPQIMRSLGPDRPRGLEQLDQQATERETLNRIAIATGGKAFVNSNGIRDAIATAVEQGSNYYALSYTPSNKTYDGRFRKIKVRLAEKGYSLHYRQGYFAEDATTSAQNEDLGRRIRAAAMQHGSPPSRQILFSAAVGPVGSKTKMNHNSIGEVLVASTQKPVLPPVVEVQHYGIDYSLQGSQLQFIPQPNETYRNVLTLMVASFDSQGTMLTATSYLGVSNLEPSDYKDMIGGQFTLHQEADVPTQAVWLRIGVQDQISGRVGTVEIPLPLPPRPKAEQRVHRLPEIEPD